MGNTMSVFISGFANIIGKIFGSPLDFLSGKSCSSVCGPTWDFICYIDNFCIANLLKLAMVAILFYMVLLFFYLIYKLGICKCIGKILCKTVWACIATWFSLWEYGCYFLCHKLRHVKRIRRRRKRDIEEMCSSSSGGEEEEEEENSSIFHNVPEKRKLPGHSKRDHLRRSLRPRSHRIRVGISGNSAYYVAKKNTNKHYDDQGNRVHDIRVTRTSKFARKGASSYRGSICRRRR